MRSKALAHASKLGEYELVRLLGSGGMAEVYEARRTGPHGFSKRFAVKRILPQLSQDIRLVQMLCDEARVHAGLSHPNLVQVVDFGEADGELYMAMDFVDGFTCSDLLNAVSARRRKVELGPALFIASEILRALAYVHEACDELGRPLGLVHRDVAPSNILLGRTGDVKLADLGIMRGDFIEPRTRPGELKGKVGYVSPEQAMGTTTDARSDQFSLAVVLAEMLIGQPLFPGKTELQVLTSLHSGNMSALHAHGSHIPEDVSALLLTALALRPDDRYRDAREFLSRISGAIVRHDLDVGAHALSAWLAELGLLALDSHIRQKPAAPAGDFWDADTLDPALQQHVSIALDAAPPASLLAQQKSSVPARQADHEAVEYRMRRAGGTIVGPLRLARMLEMIATARVGEDTVVSRNGGPFLPLGSVHELARLACRPAYRFFDFIGLRATERQRLIRAAMPRYLFDLVLSKRTGLLCARNGREQTRVYFVAGAPVFAASSEPQELIGTSLVRMGRATQDALEEHLEKGWRTGKRIGETLIAAGVIDQRALGQALEEQRCSRLTSLCRWTDGQLLFVDHESCGDDALPAPQAPLNMIARAISSAHSDEGIASLLRGAERARLVRCAWADELASALDLGGQEAEALASAGGGETLEALIDRLERAGRAERGAIMRGVFIGIAVGALASA